jgi:hypothetical protein
MTQSRPPNPALLVPELKDIGGALFKATGNGSLPQTPSVWCSCAPGRSSATPT